MKRTLQFIFVVKIMFFFTTANAQPWMAGIAQEQVTGDNLSFNDVQKAFNDYWSPKNVEKGYYYENGVKIKAGGWKQFKRWEWFWNDRVDPKSGAFPTTSGYSEFHKYQQEHPVLKSTNGSETGNWTSIGPTTTKGGYAGLEG